jgi:hypothetical protein
MFWSSLNDLYDCDDAPLASGCERTLGEELNDYDPIINGSDDELPGANKFPPDQWQDFLDAELEALQGEVADPFPCNQPEDAANLSQLKNIRAGEQARWYPFKNQMVSPVWSCIPCSNHGFGAWLLTCLR